MTPEERILERVQKSESGIPFSEFMDVALYDRGGGYYSQPRRIGREGDFFTSVSVGACFGMLLARRIAELRQKLGDPDEFAIIEQGAHDGQLAEDILAHLPAATRYIIVEPNPAYREVQSARLGDRIEQVTGLAQLQGLTGVYLSNELLDAFPVNRWRWNGETWDELRVVLEDGELIECPFAHPDPPLQQADVEEGFVTETAVGIDTWIGELSTALRRGFVLTVDYGLEEDEFFAPERRNGTLRCYRKHTSPDSPFEEIGNTDLTSQVNFGQVIRLAEAAGFKVGELTDQSHYLTAAGIPWLKELDGTPPDAPTAALLRQFQSLTHPGNMGRVFQVLELEKAVD